MPKLVIYFDQIDTIHGFADVGVITDSHNLLDFGCRSKLYY